MANIKSAKKRVEVAARNTLRNAATNSALKTYIKKFEASVTDKSDAETLNKAYTTVVKKIDQAVAKGILHKNTAARKKSAITLKFNNAAAK